MAAENLCASGTIEDEVGGQSAHLSEKTSIRVSRLRNGQLTGSQLVASLSKTHKTPSAVKRHHSELSCTEKSNI